MLRYYSVFCRWMQKKKRNTPPVITPQLHGWFQQRRNCHNLPCFDPANGNMSLPTSWPFHYPDGFAALSEQAQRMRMYVQDLQKTEWSLDIQSYTIGKMNTVQCEYPEPAEDGGQERTRIARRQKLMTGSSSVFCITYCQYLIGSRIFLMLSMNAEAGKTDVSWIW